jgi:hypothetical protein
MLGALRKSPMHWPFYIQGNNPQYALVIRLGGEEK